jgi:hypothetical protein
MGLFGGRSAPDPDHVVDADQKFADHEPPEENDDHCVACDGCCGKPDDCLVWAGDYVEFDEHPGFAQFLCSAIQSGRQENQALADEHGLENLVDMGDHDILAFIQGKLNDRYASATIRDEPPISPSDTIYEIFEMILDHYLTTKFPRQES